MRRILLVVAVGAIMVLSSVSYAFAYANPDNQGNPPNPPPGQGIAHETCADAIDTQEDNEVEAGGGPKDLPTIDAPLNCDHVWQD
jgi:hypothetical protein